MPYCSELQFNLVRVDSDDTFSKILQSIYNLTLHHHNISVGIGIIRIVKLIRIFRDFEPV